MPTSVSQQFRDYVLTKYPTLSGQEPLLRFFRYLCFSTFFDEESHQLVLPTKTIAEEFYQKPYNSHFNGRRKLEQFRDRVLPELAWSDHASSVPNSYKGKARRITNLGFDDEMLQALRQEQLAPCGDQVDFVSGRSRHRRDRYQKTAAATTEYQGALAGLPLNATQRRILDYLGQVRAGHLLLRKLNDNEEAVRQAIDALPTEVQEVQRRIIASVRQNPNVYYLPSDRGRTCRLSAQGESILGLKSEIRKAATKGWVECDLRSSQFAILAAKLEAPISRAFIATGESLWRSFYQHTHGVEADPPRPIKKLFKEAIYSICFGKSATNLTMLLNEHRLTKLLSHPIIQELLLLRKDWFRQIREEGGAFDVWGQWQSLDLSRDPKTKRKRRWEGAVAAAVIQSIEMEIIAPIFEVALRHGKSDQFGICLFQHDGATISFQSAEKQARAQSKLKEAVERRARELGVCTVLEFSQL